jgi:roadblock/LC7 domain-containing protein
MVDLDRLLQLAGAVAAGEFGVGGSLIDYKGEIDKETARSLAMLCAANTLLARTQVETTSKVTQLNLTPLKGWMMSAGDFTVCVMGEIGVVVLTDKADFNEVHRVLTEEATFI